MSEVSRSHISSGAFWPMMSIVQPYAHIFSQGLFITPQEGKPGAQISYNNHYRIAVFHDAAAEVAGTIFVPRPQRFRLPANSWARAMDRGVVVEERAKEIDISYDDPKGQPRTVVTDYPSIPARAPNWQEIIRPDHLLPISVLETEDARRKLHVSANSVRAFTRAFGQELEQFVMMVKVMTKEGSPQEYAPAWFAIGRTSDVLVMEPTFVSQDADTGAFRGRRMEGKVFNYDKLPKVPESDFARVTGRIKELIG